MSLSVNEITNTVPAIDMDITEQVDPSKYNSWHQLLRVSANVLKAMIKFKGQKPPSQVDLINIVKHSWLVSMMSETRKMLKNTKLSGFIIYEKDGIIYATTRSKQKNLNPEDLVILSHKHPVTKMILSDFHVSHGTAVFSRLSPGPESSSGSPRPPSSKVVKSIKTKCFTCRNRDATAMTQLMAPLPDVRLKPSPVWQNSMLDLFGPIEVVHFVQQRIVRKTWGVIITCLATRACWVYLAESYNTDHLLSVFMKHEARNGSLASTTRTSAGRSSARTGC